jgi:putative FmdB family regulatory protein
MPTYGYRCSQCGHELEVFQSMSAEPLRVCSECGGPLRKLLYPVGISFKGSGFYSTDYRNGGSEPKSEGGATKDKDSGSGSTDKASSDSGTKSDSGDSASTSTPAASKPETKKAESAAPSKE